MKDYTAAHSVSLVRSGSHFFEEAESLISAARTRIHLQTYIFQPDGTGKAVSEWLMQAAGRGVQVHILVDAYGSAELPQEYFDEWERCGIKARKFSPLFSDEGLRLGRRLHHKILVADGRQAIIGGINVSDNYHGTASREPWLDYAVRIEGECCGYLDELCSKLYEKKVFRDRRRKWKASHSGLRLRFRRNDWVLGKNEIHRSLRQGILASGKEITLLASYFLPGALFLRNLRRASRRGVKIRIILAGRSDVKLARLAEMYLYRHLLRSGAEIYEWHHSVLHAKIMVTDGNWMSIGSYNINHLSHYRSIELNADIYSEKLAHDFTRHLENSVLPLCRKITVKDEAAAPGFLLRLRIFFAYYFIRLIWKLLIPR